MGNKMLGGYTNKNLKIDLTTLKIEIKTLSEKILRQFIGGWGLGVKILYDELSPGIDAFDPENRLLFITSPLVGTLTPAANQYAAMAKSPLTGFIGIARSHGFFAPELKFAGYDSIIISGRSEKPSYIWINDDRVTVEDASSFWGLDTYECEEKIKKELGDSKVKVACIGKAGENLIRFASIMNDRGHAAGRCGIGAVMGSKNLKAVAVRGNRKVPVVNEKEILEQRKIWLKISSENKFAKQLADYGTAGDYDRIETRHISGDLPTKNYTTAIFPKYRNLAGQYMRERYPTKKDPCFNCHIGHDYTIEIPSGANAGRYIYPEYETTAAFGSNIGNDDTEAIIKLNDNANRVGVDVIELSHILSLVMEGYEKGFLTKNDTDNITFTWGNIKAVTDIIDKIVNRDGIGNVFAEGVKRAADHLGLPHLAVHIKGMSPVLHDLRHNWGWLMDYTVAPAGPTHQGIGTANAYTIDPDIKFPGQTAFSTYMKGEAAKMGHMKWVALDCLGICAHAAPGVPLSLIVKFLSAAVGWDIGVNELFRVVERSLTLARAFNIRQGLTVEDDWPSERILEAPPDGPAEGFTAKWKFRAMLEDYYQVMGWDPKTGKPWKNTLNDLELKNIAKDLWG